MSYFIALNDVHAKNIENAGGLSFSDHLAVPPGSMKTGNKISQHKQFHEAVEMLVIGVLEMQTGKFDF